MLQKQFKKNPGSSADEPGYIINRCLPIEDEVGN